MALQEKKKKQKDNKIIRNKRNKTVEQKINKKNSLNNNNIQNKIKNKKYHSNLKTKIDNKKIKKNIPNMNVKRKRHGLFSRNKKYNLSSINNKHIDYLDKINKKIGIHFEENYDQVKNEANNAEKSKDYKDPIIKFDSDNDEVIRKLKLDNSFHKRYKLFNTDFIERIKDNNNIINNKNVIVDEGVSISKKKEDITNPFLIKIPNIRPLIHPKL